MQYLHGDLVGLLDSVLRVSGLIVGNAVFELLDLFRELRVVDDDVRVVVQLLLERGAVGRVLLVVVHGQVRHRVGHGDDAGGDGVWDANVDVQRSGKGTPRREAGSCELFGIYPLGSLPGGSGS